MVLPNRMSFRPGLLWLTINLSLIIGCSYEIFFFQYYIFYKTFSCTSYDITYPRLRTTALDRAVAVNGDAVTQAR
jgi:hypothetical protein